MRIHFDLKCWIRNCNLKTCHEEPFSLYFLFCSDPLAHCSSNVELCCPLYITSSSLLKKFSLLIAALDSETSAHALVTGSPFLALVTSRLSCLAKVPVPSQSKNEVLSTESYSAFVCFLHKVVYCTRSQDTVKNDIGTQFFFKFLFSM